MRGISFALALGLGLCHSKVVCGSAKASGLPVQVAELDETSEETLGKSRGDESAGPERQTLLARGRTSVDALASAADSAVAKARNLLSRQPDSNKPQGTLLQRGNRRPKGTVLLNGRQAARRLAHLPPQDTTYLQDMPTWQDMPPVQEVVKEEVPTPQVPFTPCVDSNGDLQAFYGEDWQPSNQDTCREHCENFGSQRCIGYSFGMTHGCKLFSPAKMQIQRGSRKAKSIQGIVSCATSNAS